jgi:RND family efflux transporter MFP subunit
MKNKFKKNPFIGIGIIILLAIALIIVVRSIFPEEKVEQEVALATKVAEIIVLKSPYKKGQKIQFEANVKAENETAITSEVSGKVITINKAEGDTVKKGDKLFELNNRDQQISYQQALVQLDNQRLTLQNLEREFNAGESSIQGTLIAQQQLNVKNAYQEFLNNDLRVYPQSNPEDQDRGAPIVSGTYQGTQEGQYILELYASASESGASIRFSGLESGTITASTNFPIALGTQGLQIQFPIGFDTRETWVINIPNERSSSYVQSLNTYEAAQKGKNTSLIQSRVTQEQLDKQRNALRQQELSVARASAQLEKTIVRAPFDGHLIRFDVTEGAVVSAFSPVGTIKSLGELELEFSISNRDTGFFKEGDSVYRDNLEIGKIEYIAQSLNANTFKNIVRVSLNENIKVTEGETISILLIQNILKNTSFETSIPLTAIKIIGNDPYVGVINEDNRIVIVPVTIGLLFGSQIEIISGLENYEMIIKNIRGYSDGDIINY